MAKKKVERKIIFPIQNPITRIKLIEKSNSVEVYYEVEEETNLVFTKGTEEFLNRFFPIVRASSLTLESEIFTHTPTTERQKQFYEKLKQAVQMKIPDFRAQAVHPSYGGKDNPIYFEFPSNNCCMFSNIDWIQHAKNFLPEKNSRLGSSSQRIIFLGIIIQGLVQESKNTLEQAWYEVCDDSSRIACYRENAVEKSPICGFRDLGNGYKITISDEPDSDFLYFGGKPDDEGSYRPLTNTIPINYRTHKEYSSTGWIITDV